MQVEYQQEQGNGGFKNVNPQSVQSTHKPVRACYHICLMQHCQISAVNGNSRKVTANPHSEQKLH